MAEVSTLSNVIQFLDKIGVYDVVLPFLLIFTIVFAILEKTKVLGTEEIEGKKYTKKNLNAMASFVISFLVIASSKLVETITEVSSNIVVLLLLGVFFLLLVGAFFKEGEGVFLEGGWRILFMIIMFIGIVFIFLHAIKTENGESWLVWAWGYLSDNWTSTGIASIILLIIVIVFMVLLVRSERPSSAKTEEKT